MRELNKVHLMDCIEFLEGIPDNTIDACVTDPPYGLEFMGKEWDKLGTGKLVSDRDDWDWQTYRGNRGTDPLANKPRFSPVMTNKIARNKMQQFHYEWSQLVYRALKPGAHILAFSGTRTYHRLACAVEDSGFEIRDQIHWLYGSGFPKGRNIAKGIDARAGIKIGRNWKPATLEARQWADWNTVFKPAHEPIIFARKPISEESIEQNVLRWGTGAINIGGCRIAVNPNVDDIGEKYTKRNVSANVFRNYPPEKLAITGVLPSGRYPANLILSHHPDCKLIQEGTTKIKDTSTYAQSQKMGKHGIYGDYQVPINLRHSFNVAKPEIWECVPSCPVRMLNEQSGNREGCKPHRIKSNIESYDGWGTITKQDKFFGYDDSGGAARFFYCAKPSVRERNAGLNGERNLHITVKPLAIMRWLVRLVTREGGIVLDPFLGSGTTAIAAELEGFNWLGCDNNKEYCEIAHRRIKALGKKVNEL